jgi:Leucine-rich repeat (LRR) protein
MTEVNLKNLGLTEIETKGQLMLAQRIDLSFNDLKSLSFAKFMQSVTHLNLDHNQITDLNGIQSLNNLKSLSVKWNKLKSIENVIYIKGMTMEEVHLEENLFDKESLDIISTWQEFNH